MPVIGPKQPALLLRTVPAHDSLSSLFLQSLYTTLEATKPPMQQRRFCAVADATWSNRNCLTKHFPQRARYGDLTRRSELDFSRLKALLGSGCHVKCLKATTTQNIEGVYGQANFGSIAEDMMLLAWLEMLPQGCLVQKAGRW